MYDVLFVKSSYKSNMNNNHCDMCEKQRHVHELTGSTRTFNERGEECHNHRFCAISGEAKHFRDRRDHFHEVKFRTDFSDEHFHEVCTRTSGAIEVGHDKHVHFLRDCTEEKNGHKHEFQAASLIESPNDHKCD